MFTERIFSIGISKFKLNGLDNETLCEQIRYFSSNPNDRIHGQRDMNVNNPHLTSLTDVVLKESQKITDSILANSKASVRCSVTRVWGNHNLNCDICIPHVHRDSFLSAVYYPKASEDSRLHFQSPFTDALLSKIPILASEVYDEFNSSYHQIHAETDMLVIFPANLLHFVPPTRGERYSIVYDIGVKDESI
ncbi:hypothetical protein Syn7803C76_98 [Synechococcus phage ACG-2014b]|jgi:uncharacterized protein (TIGR02466 family)|uniref:2OG-Fe(II) oxygenase n=2 Tax=Synechococcus phage ACG-2014b TaxID=1493508 RepID=A0A0E3F6S7_9CAUD|nr:2OG-Fe(II) oxygenase [Synechococcus phage ACG-2014b]YP_009779723.1 2OG-Fe(II) oxygenase [Synechococcus phage ACG-2014b]YP_009779940.1 2OG-Fe(II) oxygenase [Synechococcus phage ACG-2014b]AIX17317.1 hypothetical protein Syn7803C61_95 [Synechococcus phage ACG-2014b]AIX17532.1 hypothetical protein Syn7803C66_95 [Synechococcus phage ACG-2014b]AIX17748.1 hypothetical protein Syn7803C67_96 [Synechococcus phage ACG-2014b]AIX17965.1 hypothetical protein Syn7803C68_97 [Synechococcus phage ACG-2014b]